MNTKKSRSSKNEAPDALELLREDHKNVHKLFKEFEKAKEEEGDEEEKEDLVRQICNELTVHARIEEEVFYPAVREAIGEEDLMDEAEVEHASLKSLIGQLGEMSPTDDLYDAKVTVLAEYVDHHVKEEQDEMFPKVKKADLDLDALGESLQQRKLEIKEELGIEEDSETDEEPEEEMAGSKGRSKENK